MKELPEKKRQVKSYIGYLRKKGAVVNTAIVVGIAKSHNGNLLACNGRYLVLGKLWAKSLLSRMGYRYVKRRGSSYSSKGNSGKFSREQFLIDIKAVEVEEIPADLVINWDQAGISYVPPIHEPWKGRHQ